MARTMIVKSIDMGGIHLCWVDGVQMEVGLVNDIQKIVSSRQDYFAISTYSHANYSRVVVHHGHAAAAAAAAAVKRSGKYRPDSQRSIKRCRHKVVRAVLTMVHILAQINMSQTHQHPKHHHHHHQQHPKTHFGEHRDNHTHNVQCF